MFKSNSFEKTLKYLEYMIEETARPSTKKASINSGLGMNPKFNKQKYLIRA